MKNSTPDETCQIVVIPSGGKALHGILLPDQVRGHMLDRDQVPGCKSDLSDATWIDDLLAHGLIRPSFVPPAPVKALRDLTRTRTQLVREAARHIERIQKTLENANIKLTSLISEIVGPSGQRILKLW